MAYAVPSTPAEFADLIALLVWPNDCNKELVAVRNTVEILEALRLGWKALQTIYLNVVSATEPSLADWQQAWINAGYTLPITGQVIGLWDDTVGSSMDYIWYNNAMQPRMAYWWNGSSQFFDTPPSSYTNSAAIPTTEVTMISQPLTLAMDAYIVAEHAAARNETTTTLQWRSSLDTANTTRDILFPNGTASSPRIMWFRLVSLARISSSTLNYTFRTISGTGTLLFTNTAVTRKIETGAYPYYLGESYVLRTEAIYS